MQKSIPTAAPTGERGPDVIDLGGGHFKVRSLSKPDIYRYVDLGRGFCSCPATVAKCRHKRIAEAADEMRPVYTIERNPNAHYLFGHDLYMLVETVAGLSEVIGYRPTYGDCLLDREDLVAEVS